MVLAIVSIVVILDQLSKFLAINFLQLNVPFALIKNFLYLTLVHNRGAAFGILKNQLYLFIAISFFAILFIFLYLKNKKNSFVLKLSLSLILSGAAGNLIDRLRFGYVIDFLDFRVWPVFNLADSALTIGALLLSWELLFSKDAA
ncbi:MAG: signal peptidase II [Candidatus Omnitrophota bacterium]|jgi:signal peptidase II|nr:signal peptidase II [Candidatus Omnitrophota bacterium]